MEKDCPRRHSRENSNVCETTTVFNTRCPLTHGNAATETSFVINAVALICSVLCAWLAFNNGLSDPVELFIVMLVVLLLTTGALELVFFGKRSALGRLKIRRKLSWRRVCYREVALAITFLVIGIAYWTFPAFAEESTVKYYFPFVGFLTLVLLLLSAPYFCIMDKVDENDDDALCKVGRAIITRTKTMSRFEFGNYVRSWLVKAFWLSLMQPSVVEKIRVFICYHWDKLPGNPLEIYLMASTCCYAIDLAFASSGYVLNFKLFNTQTRTTEPSLLGWIVTVVCYWPFWGMLLYPYFFRYESTLHWYDSLFETGSVWWWLWAAVIVFLELLYALSTVSAGIRFSNLTYRGLWNTGLYRLTKHPAYVFKNLSWWMIFVPFLLNSGADAVKCTVMLFGTSLLYYLRAKTEEAHLSHYPEYVAYALEMNRKSIFRWCVYILPFLKYAPPSENELRFKVSTLSEDISR